jgi:hypothetical protein
MRIFYSLFNECEQKNVFIDKQLFNENAITMWDRLDEHVRFWLAVDICRVQSSLLFILFFNEQVQSIRHRKKQNLTVLTATSIVVLCPIVLLPDMILTAWEKCERSFEQVSSHDTIESTMRFTIRMNTWYPCEIQHDYHTTMKQSLWTQHSLIDVFISLLIMNFALSRSLKSHHHHHHHHWIECIVELFLRWKHLTF